MLAINFPIGYYEDIKNAKEDIIKMIRPLFNILSVSSSSTSAWLVEWFGIQ